MSLWLSAIAFGFVLAVAALVWLADKPLPEESAPAREHKIEELLPMHAQHFPQLRQALQSTDSRYVREKLTKEEKRVWRAQRKEIVQSFLTGLAGDFARLRKFEQTVRSVSRRQSGRQSYQRAWLTRRFRLHYRILRWWIRAGGRDSQLQIARLTLVVGNLASLAEIEMAQMEIAGAREETI